MERKPKIISKHFFKPFLLFFIAIGACLFLADTCFAAFSLSATPYEGGLDLRFGSVAGGMKANKEVTISATSDIGKQYRIIQTFSPLTNSKGFTLPANSVRVYTLRSSSSAGTLGYDVESPVFLGPMILYTSAGAGRSDSFVTVYSVNVPASQAPGLYRGRLIYSLEPIGAAGQAPVIKTLNISVEVDASAQFQVETITGGQTVTLKTSGSKQDLSRDVRIKITGSLGNRYRIVQKLSRPISSSAGKQIDKEGISIYAQGGEKGQLGIKKLNSLPATNVVLYTSDARGSADEIILTFALNDINQDAGTYRGALTYTVESSTPIKGANMIKMLPIEIEITPLFNLIVTTDHSGSIVFRDLKPGQSPKTSVSYIEIQTNSDKPYQVMQKTSGPLTTKDGKTIPPEFFKLKTTSEENKGGIKYPREVTVKEGQMVLFTSQGGKSAKLKVIDRLDIPRDIHSGNYSTGITYSLLEM